MGNECDECQKHLHALDMAHVTISISPVIISCYRRPRGLQGWCMESDVQDKKLNTRSITTEKRGEEEP